MTAEAFPLSWPVAFPRTAPAHRQNARFNMPFSRARDGLLRELRLMGVRTDEVVISSNVPLRRDGFPMATVKRIEDPAVAVYFPRNGQEVCIPCDRWTRVEDNLQAIRKTVEALRGLDRWGADAIVDAAFQGFEALPAGGTMAAWWDVLGVEPNVTPDELDRAYREAVKRHHPDRGGDPERFLVIQEAFRQAREAVAA